MSFELFPDLILLLEIILFFGFAIYTFARAQRITRSVSYIYITLGIIINFIGYCFLLSTTFFSNTESNKSVVLILAIITNITLGIGFLTLMNGFILIREDRLPIFSHIAALLVGVSSMLFGFLKVDQLSYNDKTNHWELNYLVGDFKYVFITISVTILIIFIAYFILYLARKYQNWRNYKKLDCNFLGFIFLATWMVTPFFQSLKLIRHFLFPVAILCWGIAVFLDPLNMLASNKLPEEIILVSNSDYPIFRYNIREKQAVKNLDEIRMLITGKNIISESLNSHETPKDLQLKDKEIRYLKLSKFYIISIGSKIDRNSRAAIFKSFKELCNRTDLAYLETALVLKEADEKLFIDIINDNFRRIDATKKKKQM